MRLKILPLVLLISVLATQAIAAPKIFWASAKAGPGSGWEGSSTQGASITLWGTGFGASRGASDSVTACGQTLSSASDFGEWGANTNPAVPPFSDVSNREDFRRISFWLNSGMSGSAGIYVTVDGEDSNTMPFEIRSGNILFIAATGDNTDGSTLAKAFTVADEANNTYVSPGDFIYIKGSIVVGPGDWNIGYECGPGTTNLDDAGTVTDQIVIDGYPGDRGIIYNDAQGSETAHYIRTYLGYWTISGITFDGSYVHLGYAGAACEAASCTGCPCMPSGNQIIGCEFKGLIEHGIYATGHDQVIAANYLHYADEDGDSYSMYILAGKDRLIADNFVAGGNDYLMHMYDETATRCGTLLSSVDRVYEDNIIERNVFSMDYGTGNYDDFQTALIISTNGGDPEVTNSDTIVRNNMFISIGTSMAENGTFLEFRFDVYRTRIHNNSFIYGHTLDMIGVDIGVNRTGVDVDDLWFHNNVFSGITGYHIDNHRDMDITVDNNFYAKAPSFRNASDANSVTGNINFVSPTYPYDFSLQSSSDAVAAGTRVTGNTYDFSGATRPTGAGLDTLGAIYIGEAAGPSGAVRALNIGGARLRIDGVLLDIQ